eukprot:323500_1
MAFKSVVITLSIHSFCLAPHIPIDLSIDTSTIPLFLFALSITKSRNKSKYNWPALKPHIHKINSYGKSNLILSSPFILMILCAICFVSLNQILFILNIVYSKAQKCVQCP